MSLLPLAIRDLMIMSRSLRALNNHMYVTEDLLQSLASPVMVRLQRPADEYRKKDESVIEDKEKFKVMIPVKNFKPEEITVKMIDKNLIEIEAKQEEEDQQGFMLRHLVRRFTIPEDHDVENVVSSLSSDGVLTVTAPKNFKPMEETMIPVTHTGPEKKNEETSN